MNHNIGLLQAIINKSSSLIEVSANIKRLMIISRNIESEGNLLSRMTYLNTFCSRKQSFNLQFYISDKLLLRVFMFYAASRLPIQSPPRPSIGSKMQLQSYAQTCFPCAIFQIIYNLDSIIFISQAKETSHKTIYLLSQKQIFTKIIFQNSIPLCCIISEFILIR